IRKHEQIEFRQSNLFSNIKESFDLIIFNPPYLPSCANCPDIALDGGKEGYELIEKFLKQAKKHLNKDGIILLLFSSFSKKEKINKILERERYYYKEIAKQHIHFEDLYVYEIKQQ
ncbi:MAG: methyltransferase, partial [Nanoarchaeota archaeon]|nr:methyltransferase [Nanoarchaeota archaeon]